ncbi:MAG: metal-dependent hydrolase [Bacteroidetes bacterium]|nr:metal-dependent hydrolase [Bacteroidota bacterium]
MDYFTQAVLGAAVGQATMHRDIGNKAVLWGVLGGVLPDLDMLVNPLFDPVTQLTWHRSVTHGILFAVIASLLLGWLIARVHSGQITFEKTTIFALLALGTHMLIDLFTTYGTQVLAPFSDHAFSFNTLFIIDPLYTLPLLIFLLLSLLPGETRAKLFRNAIGLTLSSAYVLVALLLKFSTLTSFEREIERQHIPAQRVTTSATPFNTMLWRCVAETADGYFIGYRSVFDEQHEVSFWYVPRNGQLLEAIKDQRAVETLKWFSDGWYSVSKDEQGLQFNDLRFGEYDTTSPERDFGLNNPLNLAYFFSFRFVETGATEGPDQLTIRQADFRLSGAGAIIDALWKRLKGLERKTPAVGK